MEESASALKSIARSGKKILFVATKKQAKESVKEIAESINMPYVTERWLGGMLTNFATIRKSIKKMNTIEKMLKDGSAESMTKKERLVLTREKDKLSKILGGISQLNRLPSAIFIIDINHEHISLKEAKRLGITTFGMVDTNCDPTSVDFAVPANDDATKSIAVITNYIANAIKEGLEDRASNKEQIEAEEADQDQYDDDGNLIGMSGPTEEEEKKGGPRKKQLTRRKPGGGPGAPGGPRSGGGGFKK